MEAIRNGRRGIVDILILFEGSSRSTGSSSRLKMRGLLSGYTRLASLASSRGTVSHLDIENLRGLLHIRPHLRRLKSRMHSLA
jgi:hypothetical protein